MNPTEQLFADATNAACVLEAHLGYRSDEVAAVRRIIARFREMEAERAGLRESILELLDMLPPCDEDMHPAWCCNHQQKRCDGNAIIARAHATLAGLIPTPTEAKS